LSIRSINYLLGFGCAAQYEELSQRLVPEAINFLLNTLIHLFPHKFTADTLPGAFPCPDFASEQCRSLKIKSKAGKSLKPTTPDLSSILLGKVDNEDQVKVDLLSVTLALAENFAKLYGSSDAFIELFEPTLEVLEGVKIADFSETLKVSQFFFACARHQN
jgi:nucleolar protein 14